MHVVYDPVNVRPLEAEVSKANVNDVEVGRAVAIEPYTTYVFDKGYCSFDWWREIAEKGGFFVTRPKSDMKWRSLRHRRGNEAVEGDGFAILRDAEVKLVSKGNSKLPIPLRLIKVKRHGAKTIAVLTNDMTRSAAEIAALYKGRCRADRRAGCGFHGIPNAFGAGACRCCGARCKSRGSLRPQDHHRGRAGNFKGWRFFRRGKAHQRF